MVRTSVSRTENVGSNPSGSTIILNEVSRGQAMELAFALKYGIDYGFKPWWYQLPLRKNVYNKLK